MKKYFLSILTIWINLLIYGQTPFNEIPMYGLIQKTDEMKKWDGEFIERCQKEYKNLNEASEAHVEFGWSYFYKNDFSTAIKRFNQAWLLDSTNCNCYYGFAAYMNLIGDSDQTKYYLNVALSYDKDDVGAKKYFLSLSNLFEVKGVYDAVININKAILKEIDSTYSYSLQKLGYLYMDKKDSSNSLKYLNMAIQLNPMDSLSFLNRGWLYYEYKLYNKAISDFTKSIEIQRTYISAYANRGVSYVEIGEFDKAIDDFNTCISLVPISEQGQFYRMIGNAKIKNNDKVGGCNCLKKSMKMGNKYNNIDKKELKMFYKENCK